MRKEFWLIIILAIIIVVLTGFLLWPAKKSVPAPVGADGLQINSLQLNQEVSSPLKITGSVNGNGWAGFEGQVGNVKLLGSNGKELVSAPLTTTTDWTKLPTNFETTLVFQSNGLESGTLVFHNENPSGMPEKDKAFSLPIKLK